MMASICAEYSGVLLNQNVTGGLPVAVGGGWYYQTFHLPEDTLRGSLPKEQRYPSLSGFQLLATVTDAALVEFEYVLEEYFLGAGWGPLTKGTAKEAPVAGKVWLDAIFVKEVVTTAAMLTNVSQLRIGVRFKAGVSQLWKVSPSPLLGGEALEESTNLAGSFNFRMLTLSADSGIDYLGNPYRSVVVRDNAENTITTSGTKPGFWLSQPQPSRFAVVSYYADLRPFPVAQKYEIVEGTPVPIQPEALEEPAVVDGILLDPLTPGVAFNVYYSNDTTGDDNPEGLSEVEWEQKLWTRIHKTWITTQRQQYVFPEPIAAKFIKIEFSYLQAQAYNPGDYQIPIRYKKFPEWVSKLFIAATKSPEFIAGSVGVSYDALEFAYNYYLNDLVQSPTIPITEAGVSPLSNRVDPETLARINLVLNTFTEPPGAQADSSTLLGSKVAQNANLQASGYPTEGSPQYATSASIFVSQLNREGIVLDQSMPVMFFFLTCRHAYKELYGSFEHNRAYFAGLNEVAFLRNAYSTVTDTPIYIEAGIDDVNTERNDFVIDSESHWFTY